VTLVGLACLLAGVATAQEPSPRPLTRPTTADLERGHALFDAQCSRCHGIGGAGGAGPPLTRPRLRRAPDDEALVALLVAGIPGTAMESAWQLSERELAQVAAYVRTLGRAAVEPPPGDAARGRLLYDRSACATCHVVRGTGGGLGPELTSIGDSRGGAHLRESLVDPGASLPDRIVPYEPNAYAGYLMMRAVTAAGAEILGARVNEDSFTVQLRDAGGKVHSLRKAELRSLEPQRGASLMPSYRGTLTPAEIDDLVSYLMTLRGPP
jgi:cytochrome c oxidase cbb3-type subunit III